MPMEDVEAAAHSLRALLRFPAVPDASREVAPGLNTNEL
jgi:hypothetical protein